MNIFNQYSGYALYLFPDPKPQDETKAEGSCDVVKEVFPRVMFDAWFLSKIFFFRCYSTC